MTTVAADIQTERGKAHRHTDEALLILALLSLADVEEASSYWRRLASPRFKGLVSARRADPRFVPEAVATNSAPAFDPAQLAYVQSLGDVIPSEDVRRAVLEVIAKVQAENDRDTQAMLTGSLSLAEWQDRMQSTVKRLHLAVAAVGAGGMKQLTADQLSRSRDDAPEDVNEIVTLGDLILFQFVRLNAFAIQIEERDRRADTDEKIERRVSLYGDSAYPTYALLRGFAAEVAGFTQERNVLSVAEHCIAQPGDPSEDCPTQTAKGWVGIGELVPVGQRICRMRCKCHTRYRDARGRASA